ncbi:GntR family transcriptional regulator [Thalassococcus sp. S3]|uniref:GntR family transcriptional regulator n=1 Tax=Thalassococcus sp. S3 TaxID=2017482 RepID=UPI0010246CE2|nr:GntR family transcriptional regulator [Thalassococcus sp. S3]QBF33475.1 transcriptional regulator [Thalassococcus sp. S3]
MSVMADLKTTLSEIGGVTRSLSLAEDAAQTIREMILLEKLPPGTALPERDLAEALGVSRTPMREAIKLLANDGLVQYTASRRPFVADPSLDEICDYLRVQGALEALAGELACQKATDAQLHEVDRLNQAILSDADGDKVASFNRDMDFHVAIVRASGNAALIETHERYNARLWRARFMSSQRRVSRDSTRHEHALIVKALLARDAVATSKALKQHLKTAESNIAEAMRERAARAQGE